MKKVLKPVEPEEAIYYSDFSGRIFKDFVPVTVKLECSYGSKYDGAEVEFHLSDKGLEKLLDFFREHLCEETKNELKRHAQEQEQKAQEDTESRDWTSCEYHYNNRDLYQKLI